MTLFSMIKPGTMEVIKDYGIETMEDKDLYSLVAREAMELTRKQPSCFRISQIWVGPAKASRRIRSVPNGTTARPASTNVPATRAWTFIATALSVPPHRWARRVSRPAPEIPNTRQSAARLSVPGQAKPTGKSLESESTQRRWYITDRGLGRPQVGDVSCHLNPSAKYG